VAEARRVLDHDPAGALAGYRKVLGLNPSSDCAHRYYAWFLGVRQQGDEAVAVADRAFLLDPLCVVMQSSAADVRYLAGDYDGALARCRHALDMYPAFERALRAGSLSLVQLGRGAEAVAMFDGIAERTLSPTSLAIKGTALAAAGQADRARAIARRLERASRDTIVSGYHLAGLHAALHDVDAAFASLERACAAGDPWLDAITVDPRFACLRGDNRLQAIRARLRLD
jgi:tetratricopeptide (TPR) repeat protein